MKRKGEIRQTDLVQCKCGLSYLKVGEKCGWCGRRIPKSKEVSKSKA